MELSQLSMGGIRHTTTRYQSLIENTYKKDKICLRIKMKLEKSNHKEGIFTSWKNSASLIFALTNFQMFFIKKTSKWFLGQGVAENIVKKQTYR